MIGAKLPFVLADWPGLLRGSAWFSDGKTIVLGLVGGYLGVVLAKWGLDIKTPTGDSFVLPVASRWRSAGWPALRAAVATGRRPACLGAWILATACGGIRPSSTKRRFIWPRQA